MPELWSAKQHPRQRVGANPDCGWGAVSTLKVGSAQPGVPTGWLPGDTMSRLGLGGRSRGHSSASVSIWLLGPLFQFHWGFSTEDQLGGGSSPASFSRLASPRIPERPPCVLDRVSPPLCTSTALGHPSHNHWAHTRFLSTSKLQQVGEGAQAPAR